MGNRMDTRPVPTLRVISAARELFFRWFMFRVDRAEDSSLDIFHMVKATL